MRERAINPPPANRVEAARGSVNDWDSAIHRYIRSPHQLSACELALVEHLLAGDDRVRDLTEDYRGFYDELGQLRAAPPKRIHRVESFLNQLLLGASVIPLETYESESTPVRYADRLPRRPLSSSLADAFPLRPIDSARTAAERISLQVVWDEKLRKYRVQVLSDATNEHAHAIVSFPYLGVTVLTDAFGRADLPISPNDPRPIRRAALHVSVLVATHDVSAILTESWCEKLPAGVELVWNVSRGTVTVEVKTTRATLWVNWALLQTACANSLVSIKNGRALCGGVPARGQCSIRLFA